MKNIVIQRALPEDASTIVQLIRAMLNDMASYGGYLPATDCSAWEAMSCEIAKEVIEPSVSYLKAVDANDAIAGLGWAKLITLSGAFAPRKTLHISGLYVLPHYRRQRIGDALMTELLAWGSAADALECDLNVLVNNPAQALYARHGFSAFQVKMLRSLINGAASSSPPGPEIN